MPLLPLFYERPDEARLIGLMLAGYGELELDLMGCAQCAMKDRKLDGIFKAMFRARSEGARIDVADALARTHFTEIGVVHMDSRHALVSQA